MKNPFSAAPSLADVLARISDDAALSPARRAAVCSAVHVACRCMGIPPEMVPANVAFLSAKLKGVGPAAAGLTLKRFSTIRSDLMFALRHLGLVGPGTDLVRGDELRMGSALAPAAQQIRPDVDVAPVSLLLRT